MLRMGQTSLIERQIEQLLRAGIPRIYVVTGFARQALAYLWSEHVREIYNPEWATTNNIVTLARAVDHVPDGFLLLNADVLCSDALLNAFVYNAAPTAVSVDNTKELGEEEMKVTVEQGRVTRISKALALNDASGEYIGLARFDQQDTPALAEELNTLIGAGQSGSWYEAAIGQFCTKRPLVAHTTQGQPWTEIDTPEDLLKARREILPAIKGLKPNPSEA